MDVIAHRGFAGVDVENSLSALTDAADRADAVEFDVRLAADGVPVVFHDRTVDRLTDHAGAVADYEADELGRMCLAGTDDTIPTLGAVLDGLSGPIVPELKTDAVTDRLRSLLDGYPDPVLVSSFRPGPLSALADAFETAVLCAPANAEGLPEVAPAGFEAGLDVADDLDAAALHPHHSLCSPATVERAQTAGLAVNAWTIRSPETARAMAEADVDGVIADSPADVDR